MTGRAIERELGMNEAEGAATVVTARLPSGAPIRVEVAGTATCPTMPASISQPTDRPRLLISEDQILDRAPFWTADTDPFAWNPRAEQEDREREAGFAAGLDTADPEQPWDVVRHTLLGEI